MKALAVLAVAALCALAPAKALAVLELDLGFDPAQACPGDEVRFFASVENVGDQEETVTLEVTITFGQQTIGPLVVRFPLAAGETISKEVTFTLPPNAPPGSLLVSAVATDSSGSVEDTAQLEILSCGAKAKGPEKLVPENLARSLRKEGFR